VHSSVFKTLSALNMYRIPDKGMDNGKAVGKVINNI
jgi:hypothetical protein